MIQTCLKTFLLLTFLSYFSFSGSAQWTTVGNAGFSDQKADYTSIAINSNGTPYLAYADLSKNKRATVTMFDGANWVTVGVSGFSAGSAEYISFTIDQNDVPYIAYRDLGNGSKATVMKYDGSNWITVGAAGFSGGSIFTPSIAIDSGGVPYIAYSGSNNGFGFNATVKKYDGTNWVTVGNSGFSAGQAASTTLTFDDNNTPYIAYMDAPNGTKATVMKYDGANWVAVGNIGFSAGQAHYIKIAIDGNNTPYVAYGDGANNNKATVMKYNGANWVAVGNAGFSAGTAQDISLVIDGNDTPYVGYWGYTINSIETAVMKYDGVNWAVLDTAGFFADTTLHTSLAIDSNILYLGYQDASVNGKATVMKYELDLNQNNTYVHSEATNKMQVEVYPNPAKDVVSVNLKGVDKASTTIKVLNLVGQALITKKAENFRGGEIAVSLDGLAQGIYLLEVKNENGFATKRIVKQ